MPKTAETFQMRQLTIFPLALQVDSTPGAGTDEQQGKLALERVNEILSQHSGDLGAQLFPLKEPKLEIHSEERE